VVSSGGYDMTTDIKKSNLIDSDDTIELTWLNLDPGEEEEEEYDYVDDDSYDDDWDDDDDDWDDDEDWDDDDEDYEED
jgi:hypothetical protein